MAVYTKEYESQPEAILTNVIICPAVDLSANVAVPVHCQVENVLWDTGATNTLISQEIDSRIPCLEDRCIERKPTVIIPKINFCRVVNHTIGCVCIFVAV